MYRYPRLVTEQGYDDNEALFAVDGYKFIKRDRKNGQGGGCRCIQWERRLDLESEAIENNWIEVLIPKSKSILLGTFYRPPGTSMYLTADFNATFNEMLLKCSNENKEVIVLGDFNVNYLNNNIKSIFRLYGYKQIVKRATCVTNDSSTLIDLIFTNNTTSISKCDVFPTCISDHDIHTENYYMS